MMGDPTDPNFEAVEQRLTAIAGLAPPGGHRDRVLAAVRDALADHPVPLRAGCGVDAGSRAALVAVACSALLTVIAPWLGMARAFDRLPAEPRLVTQARAAGIDLPVHLATTTRGPHETTLSPPSERSPGRLPDAWRLRTLLPGDL
jgi:hypothetical protein